MSDSSTESLLGELLLRWEELQERGESVDPEALCVGRPELAEELKRRVAALRGLGPVLAGESTNPSETQPDSGPGRSRSGRRENATCRDVYLDLRFHASGGLGEVYAARSSDLNRDVALKFIKADYSRDSDRLRRFLLEAEVTGRLEHPGIVPVYGLGVDQDDQPCYAMRLIRGETFQEAIDAHHSGAKEGNGGPEERAMAFRGLLRRFVSICNTIAYAHSRGVLHRDIKPRNVMLGKYEETLVVDWGLARPFDREGEANVFGEEVLTPRSGGSGSGTPTAGPVGTPQYMSPEQAEGRPLGPAADVYSLGATLYAALTGRSPFPGRQVGSILNQVRRGEFPRPGQARPGVPPALEAICLKAMALDPSDRYASALDLARDVDRWLADEPVGVYREPLGKRIGRWARRHRTWVIASAAALSVAALGLAAATALLAAANDREQAAKKAAEAQRDEAERQKAQALSSFRLALGAVNRFYVRVSEDELLNAPGSQKLRGELLQSSIAFYDQLARDNPANVDLRSETGKAFGRLALVTLSTGSNQQSDELMRKAAAIFEPLATAKDARPVDRRDFGSVLHNQGLIAVSLGRKDEARDYYRQSLGVLEALVAARPDDRDARFELVKARIDLANFHTSGGQLGEAERVHKGTLELLDSLIAADPRSMAYRTTRANCVYNLGLIDRDTGRPGEAEAAFREAIESRTRLADEDPSSLVARRNLVFSHGELAQLYLFGLAQPAKAEASYREALRLAEKLASENPDASEFRRDLASVLNNMAGLYPRPAESAKARPLYERALALRRKLVQDDPTRVEFRADLAINLTSLGQMDQDLGKPAEAEPEYREGVKVLEELVRDHPGVQEAAIRLGAAYAGLAIFLESRDDHKAAIEASGRSIRTLDGVLEQTPDLAVAKGQLAYVLWSSARCHYWLADYEPARRDFDRAYGLLSGIPRELVRLARDQATAHLGDHSGAVADAEALPRQGMPPGETALELACVYAAASGAASRDPKLSAEQRLATSERHAARAIGLLREAAIGPQATPRAGEMMKTHPDLVPLRSRDDAKKLEADLEASRGR